MQGNEGLPKKGMGERLKRIFNGLVSVVDVSHPNSSDVDDVLERNLKIEVYDVARAIQVLNKDWELISLGQVLTTLGVGESEKIDYYKQNPDQYREANIVLQNLVDEKVLLRKHSEDPRSHVASISYVVINKERIDKLANQDLQSS